MGGGVCVTAGPPKPHSGPDLLQLLDDEKSYVLISSHQEGITAPILQRRKLRLREVSSVAQSQKAHKERLRLVKDLSVSLMCCLCASWQEPLQTWSGKPWNWAVLKPRGSVPYPGFCRKHLTPASP